jgi:hypothetical protein
MKRARRNRPAHDIVFALATYFSQSRSLGALKRSTAGKVFLGLFVLAFVTQATRSWAAAEQPPGARSGIKAVAA